MKTQPGRFPILCGLGVGLVALTGAGLAAQAADRRDLFIGLALGQGVLYLGAAWLVWHSRLPRQALVVVLIVAAAARLIVVAAPPYLSDDINRYIWDGRVQGADINPYRYLPVDEHLASLRDETIYPNINRGNYAPTIYPPVAQMVFFLVTRVSERVGAMKAAMVAFEVVAIVALLGLLALDALPRERILLYAWHPLTVWEIAGSGHVDAVALAFVALGFWARARRSHVLSGVALGAAMLVKFFPAVVFPALCRPREWRMPLALAVTAVAAYAVYVRVGWHVFGFLPGYAAEEQLGGGGGFYFWALAVSAWGWLTGAAEPPAVGVLPYLVVAAAVLGWLALRAYFSGEDDHAALSAGAALVFAFLVLLSPHYPWYFLLAVAFFCFVPYPPMLYLTVASFLLYALRFPAPADANRFLVESLLYGGFCALAAASWWRRHRRVQIGGMDDGFSRVDG